MDSIDELDMYEAEKRLKLYNEYRDAIRVFAYYVETELRAYLGNEVDVEPVSTSGGTYFKVTLTDVWIYEAERLQRFVPEVVIYEVGPVHVQRLRRRRLARCRECRQTARQAERAPRSCAARSSTTPTSTTCSTRPRSPTPPTTRSCASSQAIEAELPELVTPDSPTQRVARGSVRREHRSRVGRIAPFAPSPTRADVLARQRDGPRRARRVARHECEPRWATARARSSASSRSTARRSRSPTRTACSSARATRGDGRVGEDVTANVRTIRDVPLRLRDEAARPRQRRQLRSASTSARAWPASRCAARSTCPRRRFERLNEEQDERGPAAVRQPAQRRRRLRAPEGPGGHRERATSRRSSTRSPTRARSGSRTQCDAARLAAGRRLPREPRHRQLRATRSRCTRSARDALEKRDDLPYEIDGVVVKVDCARAAGRARLHEQGAAVGDRLQVPARGEDDRCCATSWCSVGRTGVMTPFAVFDPVLVAGLDDPQGDAAQRGRGRAARTCASATRSSCARPAT